MSHVGDIPHVTRVEFRAAIAPLSLGKACGKDGIANEMIVNLRRLNSDRLRNLIQKGKAPASWKFNILVPLP